MALNSIAIKQIIGAWAFDNKDEIKWMCGMVENLQIQQDGETTEKRDNNGSTIFTIDRNKSCTITFDSSVMDLNLIAALNGTDRTDGSLRVPYIERHTITSSDLDAGKITLSKNVAPISEGVYKISFHTLTTDGSLKDNYTQSSTATVSNTTFAYDSTNNKITLPASGGSQALAEGTRVEIVYEFLAESAVKITNAADKFPDAAKVRFLVLAVDLCQQDVCRALWITANNAKPQTGNTIGFNLDDTISVTLNLAYSYCDKSKDFYEITVADEDFTWNN